MCHRSALGRLAWPWWSRFCKGEPGTGRVSCDFSGARLLDFGGGFAWWWGCAGVEVVSEACAPMYRQLAGPRHEQQSLSAAYAS